jgi:penicillin-binding protein 2
MAVFNQSRSTIIRLIFIGVFIVMIAQLVNVQLVSDKYEREAMANAVFAKVIYPDRGIIYDRKGKAILNNTIMYDLMVTPIQVKNLDTANFCSLVGIDTAELKKRMLEAVLKNGRLRPSIFEALLTPQLYAKLEENIWKFEGFDLVERPVRTYPFKAGGHLLGFVGEADSNIIKRSNGFYRLGDFVGRTGLEQVYEQVLMGRRGVKNIIKDNKNRLQGSYANGKYDTVAVPGRGLRTYIDVEVQQLAEKLMANKVGAVVAIDPKTGGIIAMMSGPNYDPNDLTGSSKNKNYQKMVLDVAKPQLNRAIKGQYPPGSTFKPLGALVALDEGVITPAFGYPCGGRYSACGIGKPACTHSGGGHSANLRIATAFSCNSYFTQLYRMAVDNPRHGSVKKGYAKWRNYMNAFGLGNRTGIDLPSEDKGNIPDTSVYNKVYRNSWNSCTNLTLGIGQDMMLATPLQLANATCIVANRGYYYTPHFIKSIDGETKNDTVLSRFKIKHEVLTQIDDSSYSAVIRGMQDVVEMGTARPAQIKGINLCAKTGTAQNSIVLDGKKLELNENSMFICFAPREDPQIVVAAVVENAGFGSRWAGRIASLLVEKYLKDTIASDRKAMLEEIANANLIPPHLVRLQYIEDSTRAYKMFELTKNPIYIKRFIKQRTEENTPPAPADKSKKSTVVKNSSPFQKSTIVVKIKHPSKVT